MNYKPNSLNLKSFRLKPYKIFCKNFIFIVLFFDFFKSTSTKAHNMKLLFFKKRTHIGSILRAPYKNKSAQFGLGLIRYYLFFSIKIPLNNILYLNSKKQFNTNFKKLITSYSYFESTLITQIYRAIKIPIKFKLF